VLTAIIIGLLTFFVVIRGLAVNALNNARVATVYRMYKLRDGPQIDTVPRCRRRRSVLIRAGLSAAAAAAEAAVYLSLSAALRRFLMA